MRGVRRQAGGYDDRPWSGTVRATATPTDYKRARICYGPRAPHLSTGRQENRHGKGSDAQQQGKEETEGRQEPQEGRRDAIAVLVRKNADAVRPKPDGQEMIRLSSCRAQLRHDGFARTSRSA